jgi:hypothetical protein
MGNPPSLLVMRSSGGTSSSSRRREPVVRSSDIKLQSGFAHRIVNSKSRTAKVQCRRRARKHCDHRAYWKRCNRRSIPGTLRCGNPAGSRRSEDLMAHRVKIPDVTVKTLGAGVPPKCETGSILTIRRDDPPRKTLPQEFWGVGSIVPPQS